MMNLTFMKMNVLFMKGNNLENFLKEGYVFIKYFLCAGIISSILLFINSFSPHNTLWGGF